MRSQRLNVDNVLRLAIVTASVIVCALFLFCALRRIHYPFELEALEGYMQIMVLRVAHGLPLYPAPSLEFTPYMYPPLFFYVAAAVEKIAGLGLFALRLTSILSTLASLAVIYHMVWREVRQHLPAIAAVGLYAGLYEQCSGWFDLGRLDSFFILTLVVALYCTRYFHPSLAALAWTAAFLTKQSILPAALVILCFDLRRRKRTFLGLATFALCAGASVLWLQHSSGGWYWFYVNTVPAANADLMPKILLEFWPLDVFRPLGLAIGIIVLAYFISARHLLNALEIRFYLFTLVIFPLFWLVRGHYGSNINAMMPVYALAAILFGVSFGLLHKWLSSQKEENWRYVIPCLLIMVLLQIASGITNPGRFHIGKEQTNVIMAAIQEIRTTPGEVYVAHHTFYGSLAGKSTYADLVSLHDGMRPQNPQVRERLAREMDAALRQRFSAIVLDSEHADIDNLNLFMQLDPSWEKEYSPPVPIPGTEPPDRPAWIMRALRRPSH